MYKLKFTRKTVFPSHNIADRTQKMPSTMFSGMRKTLNANRSASNLCTSDTPSMIIQPD